MLLTAEIDSLKSDLEITEKILLTAMPLFNKEVNSRVSSRPGSASFENADNFLKEGQVKASGPQSGNRRTSTDEKPEELKKQIHKSSDANQKSLFKKIAAQTHPDNMRRAGHYEKKYKNNLFEEARAAMENGDYHSICKIAEKLEIDLPKPTEANVASLTRVRNSVSEKVNALRTSIPWKWYLESNIEAKNKLILAYINNISNNS